MDIYHTTWHYILKDHDPNIHHYAKSHEITPRHAGCLKCNSYSFIMSALNRGTYHLHLQVTLLLGQGCGTHYIGVWV
jgi:hypothetical protein